ncbi:LPS export ABC transporter permease LptG [Glacieibacterium megasporae]|uniref:LPS export ABC transporter permease LptG n=1 Tax=Glacieibacterium megasporae TaxID=2835787 RepID=UPI001C1E34D1|nr:LPS export ABC transporter permease LptG [Polymorphobacter megasporae]UAJ08837.1 LPS export ABC transporter permease LptG [Polymorphobacter megasporae]
MTLFPSRTIALYTARLLLTRTFAFLGGLVVILMTLDLLGESSKILVVPGNTDADLWHYVALRVPQIIALFLPFAVLLGTLVTLTTLNANSEVVIFKSAGISAHQILAPLIVAALGIAAINFVFNESVVVKANKSLAAWQAVEYGKLAPITTAATDAWVKGGDDLFHAGSVTGGGDQTVLHDVTIYDRTKDRLVSVVRAATARPMRGGWALRDVATFNVAKGTEAKSPSADFPSPVMPAQFTTTVVTAAFTPFWDLLPEISQQRAAGKRVTSLVAAANHKISGPLSAILMPLLGAVAAFGLARSGRLFVRAVIGMFLGFAFFVADNFVVAMGNFGTVPPLLAAWSAFLLFFLIGEAVLFRSEE